MAISIIDSVTDQRNVGTFKFPANFEVEKEGPLDTRTVVGSITELLASTNVNGDTTFQYFGMLVSVSGDGDNDGVYRLLEGYGGQADSSTIEAWEKLGTGSNDGDDSFITSGTITDGLLTLNYSDNKDPIEINFTECCGAESNELYDSAFFDENNDNVVTIETVGGIEGSNDGQGTKISTLQGLTFSQVFDLMFFPTQTPTRQHNTTTLILKNADGSNLVKEPGDATDVFEVGRVIDVLFDTIATGGNWSPNYPNSNPPVVQPATYAGDVLSSKITMTEKGIGNDGTSVTVDGVPLNISGPYDIENPTQLSYQVVAGDQKWELETIFNPGENPTDSANVELTSLGAPQTTKTSTDSFHGSYPIYVSNSDGSFRNMSLLRLTESIVEIHLQYPGNVVGNATFEFHVPTAMGAPVRIVQFNAAAGSFPSASQIASDPSLDQIGVQWIQGTTTKNVNTNATNIPYYTFTWDDARGTIGSERFRLYI